jgi:hypothetical protein
MLSDGEFVMTAKAVRGAGKGNRLAGAKKMYALMHQLERKRGTGIKNGNRNHRTNSPGRPGS